MKSVPAGGTTTTKTKKRQFHETSISHFGEEAAAVGVRASLDGINNNIWNILNNNERAEFRLIHISGCGKRKSEASQVKSAGARTKD